MLIHYYFAYVVIYNCTRIFVSVGNMLRYIMYQSFKTVSGYVLIKKVGIIYCVLRTISNTLFWKFVLYPECMYSAVCWCEMIMYICDLCYLSILLNCEWLCFMFIFIIKL